MSATLGDEGSKAESLKLPALYLELGLPTAQLAEAACQGGVVEVEINRSKSMRSAEAMKRMKRILSAAGILLLLSGALLPSQSWALGVGNIELSSRLNEPLRARISLQRVGPNELEELQVKLGTDQQFQRAGIERLFILTKLQFKVVGQGATTGYIDVTTKDPVTEPYLNFLLEATWSKGRVVREFTVLLDPPVYGAQINARSAPAPARSSRRASRSRQAARPRRSGYVPTYGPVRRNETLWSIASRVRPSTSISVQRMMLAILRANPDAFALNNINALRAGVVLRIPAAGEVSGLAGNNVLGQVREHQAVWEEYRRAIASGATPGEARGQAGAAQVAAADQGQVGNAQPDTRAAASGQPASQPSNESAQASAASGASEAGTPESVASSAAEQGDSEAERDLLNILSSEGSSATADSGTAAAELAELRDQLAVAQEESDAQSRETNELRDRVSQAEELIGDLQRLIDLRDSQLAEIQAQLRAAQSTSDEQQVAQASRDDAEQEQASPTESSSPAESTAGESSSGNGTAEQMAKQTPETQTEPEKMAAAESSASGTSEEKKDPQSEAQEQTSKSAEPEQSSAQQSAEDGKEAARRKAAEERRERARQRREAAQQKAEDKSFLQKLNDASPVPIPAVLGVLGAGLLGFGAFRWMRKRKAATDDGALVDLDVTDHGDTGTDDQAFADSDIGGDTGTGLSTDIGDELAGSSSDDLSLGVGTVDEDVAQRTLIDGADTVDEVESGTETAVTTQPIDGDEDPLAEVNVYLAYERFDQAEQLVQNAIENYPDRDDYKLKLLEVYQASGDTEKFEQTAASLREKTGEDSPIFEQAKSMWDQMSVGRGLLAGAGLAAAGAAAASAVVGEGSIFDVTEGDDDGLGDAEATNVDFDLGFDLDADEGASASSALDLDLGQPSTETSGEAAGAESGLDFDLASLDTPETSELDAAETGLDFDLGDLDEASSLAEAGQEAAGGESMLDFDLGDLDEDTQAVGSSAAEPATSILGESFADASSEIGNPSEASLSALSDEDSSVDIDLDFGEDTFAEESQIGTPTDDALELDLGTAIGGDSSIIQSAPIADADDLDFDLGSIDDPTSGSKESNDRALDVGVADEQAQDDLPDLDLSDLDGVGASGDSTTGGTVEGEIAEAASENLSTIEAAFSRDDDEQAFEEMLAETGLDLDLGSLSGPVDSLLDEAPAADADSGASDTGLSTIDPADIDAELDAALATGGLDLELEFDDPRQTSDSDDGSSSIDLDLSSLDGGDSAPSAVQPEIDTVRLEANELAGQVDIDQDGVATDLGESSLGESSVESSSGVDTDFSDIFAVPEETAGGLAEPEAIADFDIELDAESTDLTGFGEVDHAAPTLAGEDVEKYEATSVLPPDALDQDPREQHQSTLVLDTGESSQIDEMQTKLDLARAYMDIGDTDGARGLLGEVLAEGDETQQSSARDLLGELG